MREKQEREVLRGCTPKAALFVSSAVPMPALLLESSAVPIPTLLQPNETLHTFAPAFNRAVLWWVAGAGFTSGIASGPASARPWYARPLEERQAPPRGARPPAPARFKYSRKSRRLLLGPKSSLSKSRQVHTRDALDPRGLRQRAGEASGWPTRWQGGAPLGPRDGRGVWMKGQPLVPRL